MVELKNKNWLTRLSKIDYAFQPIVNIYTGNSFGFEALLRFHKEAGFLSIDDIFNQAYQEGLLHQVDLYLRRKALVKFAGFKGNSQIKMFYNIDNRIFDSKDYTSGCTASILNQSGYLMDDICFEISEKQPFRDNMDAVRILEAYRSQGYKIAVDDCGTGFSGLQMLYYTEPDYIKIDRFFIQNMENDPKKRLVVSTIVNFAHFMGSLVLAEGVETMEEFFLCKEIGCDMVQRYFIQKPELSLEKLQTRYEDIGNISRKERRNASFKDRSLIAGQVRYIKPVYSDCDIITIFDKFRTEESASFFPIVNRYEEPVGLIRETAFKDYIFSKFGRQLLENPSFGKDISKFMTKIPIADIHQPVEKLIETYSYYDNAEGLIMVDDMKYVGILSTKSLLKIINEKNLTLARNQNPLTRLPGNMMIHEYFSESLADHDSEYGLVYFDFDNFKPFNDQYGFRTGDRLILMFAELLKEAGFSENRFIGHIGGDDFFMGIKNTRFKDIEAEMTQLARRFKTNAESFYDKETIEKGFLEVKSRAGRDEKINLITVSIGILQLPSRTKRNYSLEKVSGVIARLKKEAKASTSGIATADITELADMEPYGALTEKDLQTIGCRSCLEIKPPPLASVLLKA
jgi:diguanylate cyclase (GGDEF)-like protein